MNEPIIETCDLDHKYYKEASSDTRCPHCLAIGLEAARAENKRLIDEAHLEVRATYDSTVAQAWREKLAAVEMERGTAHQILVDICNVVGACTADVSLAFLTHLPGEVKAQLAKEHQTAVDLFSVIAEIAGLVGIADSEPELCRKVVTAVKWLVELNKETVFVLEPFASVARAWDELPGTKTMSDFAIMRSEPYRNAARLLEKLNER